MPATSQSFAQGGRYIISLGWATLVESADSAVPRCSRQSPSVVVGCGPAADIVVVRRPSGSAALLVPGVKKCSVPTLTSSKCHHLQYQSKKLENPKSEIDLRLATKARGLQRARIDTSRRGFLTGASFVLPKFTCDQKAKEQKLHILKICISPRGKFSQKAHSLLSAVATDEVAMHRPPRKP